MLSRRNRPVTFLFVIFHLSCILLGDLSLVLPQPLPFSRHYTEMTGDPLFLLGRDLPWFRAAIFVEIFLQLPLLISIIFKPSRDRVWMYAGSVVSTTAAAIGELLWGFPGQDYDRVLLASAVYGIFIYGPTAMVLEWTRGSQAPQLAGREKED